MLINLSTALAYFGTALSAVNVEAIKDIIDFSAVITCDHLNCVLLSSLASALSLLPHVEPQLAPRVGKPKGSKPVTSPASTTSCGVIAARIEFMHVLRTRYSLIIG